MKKLSLLYGLVAILFALMRFSPGVTGNALANSDALANSNPDAEALANPRPESYRSRSQTRKIIVCTKGCSKQNPSKRSQQTQKSSNTRTVMETTDKESVTSKPETAAESSDFHSEIAKDLVTEVLTQHLREELGHQTTDKEEEISDEYPADSE